MNFLVPLGFLFAAVLPVIVLMYLLRLKRQKVQISSILLWRKSIQDLQANAPFQKLRNNLLLWLQLLIALLLVFALARPMMNLAGVKGQSYIALVDTSASMKAEEAKATRMDLAKDSLKTLIKNMARGDEMMIVAFDREARVLQTFTNDQTRLLNAANGIEARDATSEIHDALLLARTAAEARAVPVTIPSGKKAGAEQPKVAANVQVVILSDGAISDLDRTPENVPPVKYVPIGSAGENAGIVSLDLRETFERNSDRQVFATVENFGPGAVRSILQCNLDGQLIDAKEIALAPKASTSVIFSHLKDRSGKMELRLANTDQLPTDNTAFGVLSPRQKIKILMVTSNNPFLEKLLVSNPNYSVSKVRPGEFKTAQDFDVVVFDNVAPKQLPPGRYLLINALPPLEGFAMEGEPLASPAIIDWNRVHPLTRYVNFESINISRALHVKAPSWVQTLAEGPISPLVFAMERDQRQIVGIGFDLYQSDWPLRVSFPIFINNTMNWLARSGSTGCGFAYLSGASIPFAAGPKPLSLTIRTPSNAERKLSVPQDGTAYFSQTDEVGMYAVDDGKSKHSFSVNLNSREESNLAPRESLLLRDREVKGTPQVLKENREIWWMFALAALGVLLIEWVIYCRRAWV